MLKVCLSSLQIWQLMGAPSQSLPTIISSFSIGPPARHLLSAMDAQLFPAEARLDGYEGLPFVL